MKSVKVKALCTAFAAAIFLTACGGESAQTSSAGWEKIDESDGTEPAAEESSTESSTESSADGEWAEVLALGLDDDTMLAIYNDYMTAWETSPNATEEPGTTMEEITAQVERQNAYEEQVSQDIGEKYGLSAEDADWVYLYVTSKYDELMANKGADVANIDLKYNDLLDVTTNGGTIVIKAKVTPSWNNNLTVKSCGMDIYEAIQDYGLNQYNEIQYWGVADMTDGTEQKVISFTVPKDLIEKIANESILENQVVQNASDVWVHRSLADWNS